MDAGGGGGEVAALLEASRTALSFGVNGRELVLRAAAKAAAQAPAQLPAARGTAPPGHLGAQEVGGSEGGAAVGGDAADAAQALCEAVPARERPSVAYINRAATPRVARQARAAPRGRPPAWGAMLESAHAGQHRPARSPAVPDLRPRAGQAALARHRGTFACSERCQRRCRLSLPAALRAAAVGGSALAAAARALGGRRGGSRARARAQALASRLMGEQLAACLAAAGAAAAPAAAAAAGPRLWARCRTAALAQELAAFRQAGGRAAYARAAAGARACASFLPPEPKADPARAGAAAPAGGHGARPAADAGGGAAAGSRASPAGMPAAAAACSATAAGAAREARACGDEPPRKRPRAAPALQGGAAPQQGEPGGAGRALPAAGVLLDADIDWDAVGAPDAGCVSGGSGDDSDGPPAAHKGQSAESDAGEPAGLDTAGPAGGSSPARSPLAPEAAQQPAKPIGARDAAARAPRTPRLRSRGGADVPLAPAASTPVGDPAASMRLARSSAAAGVPGGARDGGGACALLSDGGGCKADAVGAQGGREPLGDGCRADSGDSGAATGEPEAGPGACLAARGRAQQPEQPRQRAAARSGRAGRRAEAGGRGGAGRAAAAGVDCVADAREQGPAAAQGRAAPGAHLPAIRGFVRALLDPLYEAGVRACPGPALTSACRHGLVAQGPSARPYTARSGPSVYRVWLARLHTSVLTRPPSAHISQRPERALRRW